MEFTKIIVTIAVTFAITITLAMQNIGVDASSEEKPSVNLHNIDDSSAKDQVPLLLPSKRVSRFLQEKGNNHIRNPNAADHCHKDNEVCGNNSTCCNNKCVNLVEDPQNCGACKNKCKFTYTCCKGKCVDTSFDKRHCGECNNRCPKGDYCIYGMCNYA